MDPTNKNSTLSRRPEARGFRVEHILDEAEIGRLRVPAFQRPLRWRTKNVIDLFDSIRRGFPIGEFLLSRDRADAAEVKFGPVSIDAGEQTDALWVIDGQQRITALVATLLREEKIPSRDFWAIWYDLEDQTFSMLMSHQPKQTWIPLNVLSDSVKQLKWIRAWPLGEEREDLVNRALELGKAIREYEIPAYIVEGANEQLLRMIFTRSNTGGVGMRESEIFEALYGDEGDKPIRSSVARLRDLGFGQLDEDLFLRCLRVTCNVSRTDTIDGADNLPPDAIRKTEKALRRAITVISASAGIPHWKLLPYRLPLILLTVFYDKFQSVDNRIDRLVAKWIWRGALTGDHGDVTDARVIRLAKQIREADDPNEVISKLLARFKDLDAKSEHKNSPTEEIEKEIRLNRASGKIFILGLLAANPTRPTVENQHSLFDLVQEPDEDDLVESNNSVNDNSNTAELDPQTISRSITGHAKFGTDTIIRIPNVQNAEILNAEVDVLHSFLLTPDAVQFIKNDQFAEFRECRGAILRRYFEEFVKDRLGDLTDIRPSISAIVSSANAIAASRVNK